MGTALTASLATVGGLVGLAILAWPVAIWWEVDMKCEKPKYKLLRTLGKRSKLLGFCTTHAVEIRQYAPNLIAEVTVSESENMREALSQGFRAIAGFIFGKNVAPGSNGQSSSVAMTSPVALEMTSGQPAKIAMTSPVTAEMSGNGEYKISFIMPSQYTKETLPKPLNDKVEIKEMPARTLAALRWNGRSPRSELEVEERRKQLSAVLKEAGLDSTGPVHLWQYHPPFAMSWQRVNEVLVEIKGGEEAVVRAEA